MMSHTVTRKTWMRTLLLAGLALHVAGCGSGTGESESKMTSYSTGENKADTANFFTVLPEQMSHVQVVTVEKSKLPRVLRLTGAVAYNAFKTTPVFSAVGGPVQEIQAEPGQNVHAGQTLLTVTSPDYSAARSAYMKARSTFELADKNYDRAKDLYEHKAIAEREEVVADDAALALLAEAGKFRCRLRWPGRLSNAWSGRDSCYRPAPRSASPSRT